MHLKTPYRGKPKLILFGSVDPKNMKKHQFRLTPRRGFEGAILEPSGGATQKTMKSHWYYQCFRGFPSACDPSRPGKRFWVSKIGFRSDFH